MEPKEVAELLLMSSLFTYSTEQSQSQAWDWKFLTNSTYLLNEIICFLNNKILS
jgi:hypothetical protein